MVSIKGVEIRSCDLDRFYKNVHKTDTCWWWLGAEDKDGYGTFCLRHGLKVQANRLALAVKLGNEPKNKACHTCDRPGCVNSDHLYDGTHLDNVRDRVVKGRSSRGMSHHNNKLSIDAVLLVNTLLNQGKTLAEISAIVNVSTTTISFIKRGKTWSHITGRARSES